MPPVPVREKSGLMEFNLNQFLLSVSSAMDFVEMEMLGVRTNHGKRVAYIALKVGKLMGLSDEELFDAVSYAILHDNALCEEKLTCGNVVQTSDKGRIIEELKEHCVLGERNVRDFPFLLPHENIIKYHHERYDGNGFFGVTGDEIPLAAQIIAFANYGDHQFNLGSLNYKYREDFLSYIEREKGKAFSRDVVEAFSEAAGVPAFWLDMQNHFVGGALEEVLPSFTVPYSWQEILRITRVFSRIIDCKSQFTLWHSSGLEANAARMADYYHYPETEQVKLCIAASLHDVGKLAIPTSILNKNGPLTAEERSIMQAHVYYTRAALRQIKGFEEITEWAANHHETLNGSGYPYGRNGAKLGFNCRLLACLDIYQALVEERPYRRSLSHEEALNILFKMKDDGLIDGDIVNDMNIVLDGTRTLHPERGEAPFAG